MRAWSQHYTGGLESLGPGSLWNMTDMFTDSFFAYGNELFLQHHLSHSTANTFQYRFSYHVSSSRRHKLTFSLLTASLLLQCRASTTEWRRLGCTATTAPPSPTVTSSTSSGIHSGTRHAPH